MSHHSQVGLLGVFLGLALVLPGCENGNEKQAKIEGTVPNDGVSTQERRQQSRGTGEAVKAAGAPGKK